MSELMRIARAAANCRSTAETATLLTKIPNIPTTDSCASCSHYRDALGETAAGWCRQHHTETWGSYAHGCDDDWTPADPAALELERRRCKVVAELAADPTLRYAFDVKDATLIGPSTTVVLVLLGFRDATGHIVTGQLRIPPDRWPGINEFTEFLRQTAEENRRERALRGTSK